MILGLDVSSSSTGYTILNKDGSFVESSFIRLTTTKKLKDKYDKLEKVEQVLRELKKKHDVKQIFVEEMLSKMKKGRSTPQTLITCAWFNGAVCNICNRVFGVKPILVKFANARKHMGIRKANKKLGENIKEVVMKKVVDIEPGWILSYTAQGNITPGLFDAADSYVIAKAGYGKVHLNQPSARRRKRKRRKK
jgi:Holliday junction resolvasome RuvABC endonuclease subunit